MILSLKRMNMCHLSRVCPFKHWNVYYYRLELLCSCLSSFCFFHQLACVQDVCCYWMIPAHPLVLSWSTGTGSLKNSQVAYCCSLLVLAVSTHLKDSLIISEHLPHHSVTLLRCFMIISLYSCFNYLLNKKSWVACDEWGRICWWM